MVFIMSSSISNINNQTLTPPIQAPQAPTPVKIEFVKSVIKSYSKTDSFTTLVALFAQLSKSQSGVCNISLDDLDVTQLYVAEKRAYDDVMSGIDPLPEEDKSILLKTPIKYIFQIGVQEACPVLYYHLPLFIKNENTRNILLEANLTIASLNWFLKRYKAPPEGQKKQKDTIERIYCFCINAGNNSTIIEEFLFNTPPDQIDKEGSQYHIFDSCERNAMLSEIKRLLSEDQFDQKELSQIKQVIDLYLPSSDDRSETEKTSTHLSLKKNRLAKLLSTMPARQILELYNPDLIPQATAARDKLSLQEFLKNNAKFREHAKFHQNACVSELTKHLKELQDELAQLPITFPKKLRENITTLIECLTDEETIIKQAEELKNNTLDCDLSSASRLQKLSTELPDRIETIITSTKDLISSIIRKYPKHNSTIFPSFRAIISCFTIISNCYGIKEANIIFKPIIRRIFEHHSNQIISRYDDDLNLEEMRFLEQRWGGFNLGVDDGLIDRLANLVDPKSTSDNSITSKKESPSSAAKEKESLLPEQPSSDSEDETDIPTQQQSPVDALSRMLDTLTLADKTTDATISDLTNLLSLLRQHINTLPKHPKAENKIIRKLFEETRAHVLLAFEQLFLVKEMYQKGNYHEDGGFACVNGIILDTHVAIESALNLQYYLKTGQYLDKTHDLKELYDLTKEFLKPGDKTKQFLKDNSHGMLAARYPYQYMDTAHGSIKRAFTQSNPTEQIGGAINLLRIMTETVFLSPASTEALKASTQSFYKKVSELEQSFPKLEQKRAPEQLELFKDLSRLSNDLVPIFANLPKKKKTAEQIKHYIRLLDATNSFIIKHPEEEETTFLRTRYQFTIEKTYEEIFLLLCNLQQKPIKNIHNLKELIESLEIDILPKEALDILSKINIGNNTHYLFNNTTKDKYLLKQTFQYSTGIREKSRGIKVVRTKQMPQLPEKEMKLSLKTFNDSCDTLHVYLRRLLDYTLDQSKEYMKKHQINEWHKLGKQ